MNQQRLQEEFFSLVRINSPSGSEKEIALYLRHRLQNLGLTVSEDQAGNLVGRLPGTRILPAILFCAHMDTVPGENIEPEIRDGVIYSAGDTILGADDKAGVAAILEALRIIKEKELQHGPIEVLFSVGEEQGLQGAKKLDLNLISAQLAFVLDGGGDVGSIIFRGPCQNYIEATITGKAAHAGINPEDGVSAIKVAARAIDQMTLGRIDAETTSNIGVIQGGVARNIVPEQVLLFGEVRSFERSRLDAETERMHEILQKAAQDFTAQLKFKVEFLYPEFQLSEDSLLVRIAQKAVNRLGLEAKLEQSGGGSDANILNARGLPTLNLGIAMRQVHSSAEHISIADLVLLPQYLVEINHVYLQMN